MALMDLWKDLTHLGLLVYNGMWDNAFQKNKITS